jgi:hypothetical protein
MIIYRLKMRDGNILWNSRMIKMRRNDPTARRNFKRFRRMWFWYEERWNQRHGIKNDPS